MTSNINKWICITKDFTNFTYGKIYEGIEKGNLLDVANDKGERHLPAIFGYNGPGNFVEYFVTVEKWKEIRNNKIQKILCLK
jgi:hypothetical protein